MKGYELLMALNTANAENIRKDLDHKLSLLVQTTFRSAAEEWKLRFPKRRLELKSGMGDAFFTIDGSILHISFDCGAYSCSWEGWKNYGRTVDINQKNCEVFKELYNVTLWYYELLENHEYSSNYLIDETF